MGRERWRGREGKRERGEIKEVEGGRVGEREVERGEESVRESGGMSEGEENKWADDSWYERQSQIASENEYS